MEWTLLLTLGGAWLISPVILLIALLGARSQLAQARQRLAAWRPGQSNPAGPGPFVSSGGSGERFAPVDLDGLLLLRQEFERLRAAGELSEARAQTLTAALDQRLLRHLSASGVAPETDEWRRRRAEAWQLLTRSMDSPPGPPPWIQPAAATAPTPIDLSRADLESANPPEIDDDADLILDPLAFEPAYSTPMAP
ncbi:hypothetical protein, partial [Thiocystis violacea]|uniref:hypothetical protein n=1 Tax=Thiocystis violacea TaxID=13725 RepID=UPI00190658CB